LQRIIRGALPLLDQVRSAPASGQMIKSDFRRYGPQII